MSSKKQKKRHYHYERHFCECGRPAATRYKGEACCLRCYKLDTNPVRQETCGYKPIPEDEKMTREWADTKVRNAYRKWAKRNGLEVVSFDGTLIR